jgi:hypothetical protein
MDLNDITTGGPTSQAPVIGLKDIDPVSGLDKGGNKSIPLSDIGGGQDMIQTHPGRVPDAYTRVLGDAYHPEFNPSTIQSQLAEKQSVIGAGINTVAGLPGTVIGAAVKDIGYLLGGPSMLTQEHENSFARQLIKFGETLSKGNEEEFPIFRDEANAPKVDLFSPTYWMKNIRTIQEMMPVAAAAYAGGAAIGGVAGAFGASPFVEESTSLLTKMGVNRHLFNMMFASSNYKEEYQNSIDRGLTPEEADKKGAIAAATSYKKNWALAPLDLAQYALWANAFGSTPKTGYSMALAKMMGKAPETFMDKVGLAAKEALIGGGQMGWQWAMNEEGKYAADKAFDPSLNIPSSVRAARYLKSGDMWSNVFFGGVAGGLLTGIVDKAKELWKGDPQVHEVKEWGKDLDYLRDKFQEAEDRGDSHMRQEALDESLNHMGIRGAASGMLEQTIDWFKKLSKGDFTPEEASKLGLDPDKIGTLKDVEVDKAIDRIKKAAADYDAKYKDIMTEGTPLNEGLKKLYNERTADKYNWKIGDMGRMYASILSKQENKINDYVEYSTKLQSEITDSKNKIPGYDLLSPTKQQILDHEANLEVYNQQKDYISKWIALKTNNDLETERDEALAKAKTPEEKEAVLDKYQPMLDIKASIDQLYSLSYKNQTADIDARIENENLALKQLNDVYKSDSYKDYVKQDKKVSFNPNDYYEYKRLKSVKARIDNSLVGDRTRYDKYRKGEISDSEARENFNKLWEQNDKDNTIEQSDYVNWKDKDGKDHLGKVMSIDGDRNYTVQEINPDNYNELDAPPEVKSEASIGLVEKIGDSYIHEINIDSTSDADQSPEQVWRDMLETTGLNRALSQLYSSLSTSHLDNKKVVIRDADLDTYTSDPANNAKDASKLLNSHATYEIDWKNKFWKEGDDVTVKAKNILRDKYNAGELTAKEIEKHLSTKKGNEENFSNDLVDKMPIKVVVHIGDETFSQGLYIHDSDFWNVDMPTSLSTFGQNPADFILQRRQECRAGRREMLTHLLSGNEVSTAGLRKMNGHLNIKYDKQGHPVYDNVHKRLGVDSGTLKVWVGTVNSIGIGRLKAGSKEMKPQDGISKGGIYVETNKTCDGKPMLIKLSPARLSPEHADILYDAIKQSQTKDQGLKSMMDDKRVEGVNVGEVIKLLTLFGDRATNPTHPNNMDKDTKKSMMPDYLKSKALYVHHDKLEDGTVITALHFGALSIDLFPEDAAQEERNRQQFIDWAITNKNYRVPIADRFIKDDSKNSLELNSPFERYFRIGSLENAPDENGKYKPYSAVLLDANTTDSKGKPINIISTSVDRLDDPNKPGQKIETVTHSPLIDLNNSKLTVRTKGGEEVKPPEAPKPKAPAPSDIEKPEEVAEKTHVDTLKQLPSGTRVYYEKADGTRVTFATVYTTKSGARSHINLEGEAGYNSESFKNDPVWHNRQSMNLNKKNQEEISNMFSYFMGIHKRIGFEGANEDANEKVNAYLKSKQNEDGTITVHRGIKEGGEKGTGQFWTTDKKVAMWYAGENGTVRSKNITFEEAKKHFMSTEGREGVAKDSDIFSLPPEATSPIPLESKVISGFESLDDIAKDILGKPLGKEKYKSLPGTETIGPAQLDWFTDKFGKQNVKLTDKLIEIAGQKGKKYFGSFQSDLISIFKAAPGEVLYHEAFHRVSRGYLSDFERAWVYNDARKRYGLKDATDGQIEEVLADKFMAYKVAMEEGHPPKRGVMEYIKDLYDFIKSFFTGESRLRSFDVEKLFDSIERGKFRYSKIQDSNLEKLKGKSYGYMISDTDIPTVDSIKDMNDLTKGLSSILINENHINDLNDLVNVGKGFFKPLLSYIDHEPVKGKILSNGKEDKGGLLQRFQSVEASTQLKLKDSTIDDVTREKLVAQLNQTQKLIALYKSILDPKYLPIFIDRINTALRSYNISARVIDKEDFDTPDMYLSNLAKASYEFDTKDTVLASIKFLIATLPNSDKLNPMTFSIDHVDFNDTWHNLLFDLWDKDSVDEILKKLDSKSDIYSYKALAQKLRDGDDMLRNQFKVAMNKQKHMYVNFVFTLNDLGTPTFNMSKADVFSASTIERTQWSDSLYNTDLVDKSEDIPGLSKEKVSALLLDYHKFTKEFNDIYESTGHSLTDEQVDTFITRAIPYLNKVGIDVDRATIDEVVNKMAGNDKTPKSQALSNFLVGKVQDGIMNRLLNESNKKTMAIRQLFSDESTVKSLSETKYEVHPDLLNDSVLGPGGNQYFTYAQNTYLSDITRQLGKDKSAIADKLGAVYNGNSDFLTQLLDDNVRRNFKLLTFSSFIHWEGGDKGRDYLGINRMEDYLLKMYGFEHGEIAIPTMGDKGMYHFIQGLKSIDFDLTWEDGKPIVPDKVVDLFYKYAQDEETRIERARAMLPELKKLSTKEASKRKDLYENYHYVRRGRNFDFDAGNALKHLLFPSFDKRVDAEGKKEFVFNLHARDIIKKVLSNKINDELKYADKIGLIEGTVDKDGRYIPNKNLKLDASLVKYHTEQHGSEQHAIESLIARNTIRTIQSSIEFGKMFVGDPAFKKFNTKKENVDDDYIKRLGGALSTGDVENNEAPEYGVTGQNYKVATVYTQKINLFKSTIENIYESLLDSQLEDAVKQFSQLEGGEGLIGASKNKQLNILKDKFNYNLKSMLAPFNEIDPTDGQTWISPAMYRSLATRIGEWGPAKEEAFNLLQSDRELTPEEYHKSLNVVMQPLKLISFGIMRDGDLEVPMMDKMSMATIFRQMGEFGGNKKNRLEIMDLLDRMEGVGKYMGLDPIHMIKMDSAVKSGGKMGFEFYKDEEQTELNDFTDIPVFEQPFSLSRKQLNTDPHDQADIKVGTQVLKMGISNIRMNEESYDNPRGGVKKISGSAIVDHIIKATGAISDKGKERLIGKLGIIDGRIDREKLVQMLKRTNQQAGVADLIADAFKMDEDGTSMYLDLDAFPNRKQIYTGLLSSFGKDLIDTKMPGGQLVQFSNELIRHNKSDELKFTTANKEGINSMECYVSLNLFKDIIPNYDNISFAEKRKYVLDRKDDIMGYRIPTQAQGSAWVLKVKDVYPETIGDVITLPSAFTALTGSDFDIDKVYALRHNYTIIDNIPHKIGFYDTPQEVWDKEMEPKYKWIKDAFTSIDELETGDQFAPDGGADKFLKTIDSLGRAIDDDVMDQDIKDGLIYNLRVDANLGEFDRDSYNKLKAAVGESIEDKKTKYLDKYKDETDPYKFNSSKAVENLLQDSYKSVYESLAQVRSTTTPLGSNVEMAKELAREVHKFDEQKYSSPDLTLHTPSKQADVKMEYTGGKDGMAPFALNNVHHILSQVAGLRMKYNPGDMLHQDSQGNLDLSQIYGKDNLTISSWLSALIDLHIDVAKDPVVTWLNLNPITWDTTALLIRGGFGMNTFKFLSQPILKEYANLMMDSTADSKISRFNSMKEVVDFIKDKYTKQLAAIDVKNGMTPEEAGKIRNVPRESLINESEMMDNIRNQNKEATAEYISKQLEYFDIFQNLTKAGKKLNGLVQACQIDTKKFGTTITNMIDFQNKIEDVINGDQFVNVDKLLGPGSFLGTYYQNFFIDGGRYLSDLTIYSTPVFNKLLDSVRTLTKTEYAADKKLVDNISDELMGAVYAKFFYGKDENEVGLTPAKLTATIDQLTRKLQEIKSAKSGYYKELADNNSLIKILNKYPVENIKEKLPFESFLSIPNKNLKDKFSSDSLMYSVRDLFKSPDPSIQQFARQLFLYSYFTSGFRQRMFSFHNYFPPEILKEFMGVDPKSTSPDRGKPENLIPFSFNEFIKEQRQLMADPTNTAMFNHLIDDTIINNWQNSSIVPVVLPKNRIHGIAMIGNKDHSQITAFVSNKWNLDIGKNQQGQPLFVKYVTTYANEQKQLCKLIGYVVEKAKSGKEYPRPVYKIIPKRSFEKGGIVIKEYLFDESSIASNNVKGIADGDEVNTLKQSKVLHNSPVYESFVPIEDYEPIRDNKTVQRNLLSGSVVEEDLSNELKDLHTMNFTKGKENKGDEISSTSNGLAFALTNPTHTSPKGFEWNRKWTKDQEEWRQYLSDGIDYNGHNYKDVEQAYQKNKEGKTNSEKTQMMLELIITKLKKYPRLTEGISSRGGLEYILDSTHTPRHNNSYWETGGSNAFLKILAQAYLEIKGREDVKPSSLDQLDLPNNITFKTSKQAGYPGRTKENAAADATLAIARNFTTRGEELTKTSAGKKWVGVQLNDLTIHQEDVDAIVKHLNDLNAHSLNIAGNSLHSLGKTYTQNQIDEYTHNLLKAVLNDPNLKTKITSIVTGGQSGFDEAGAKAGSKEGIPTTVNAPAHYLFRDISGADISDELQFKQRFSNGTKELPETKEPPAYYQPELFGTEQELNDRSDMESKPTLEEPPIEELEKYYLEVENRGPTDAEMKENEYLSERALSRLEDGDSDIDAAEAAFWGGREPEVPKEMSIFDPANKEMLKYLDKLDIHDWADVTKEEWDLIKDKYKHCI